MCAACGCPILPALCPQLPCLPWEHRTVSQPYRRRCCCPRAQGAHYILHSAHPALLKRAKTPLVAIAKALVRPRPSAKRVLQHPVPSQGCASSQRGHLANGAAALALALHCPLI